MFALSPPFYEPLPAQKPKPLGNGGCTLPGRLSDLTDTSLSFCQTNQKRESGLISQSAEEAGRFFQGQRAQINE
ncbi:luciferase-like monooxygenase [Leptospira ryugenii]|uniref:Luciferase-like monooxygenase n=1 Tax=Leptospira ryugenii TaxID=1917863 RepID=A0A2P2E183_9LEPT|nr:luciferase-like monooxygenase [Leptospira ryugenii]